MFFLRLLSKLPLSVLYILSWKLYILAYYIVGYRKKVVFTNLKNSFPEKDDKEIRRIGKRFYKNLADIVVEIIKAITIPKEELKKRVVFKNAEVVNDYITSGQSIIAVSSHQCNWEWMLLGSCAHLPFPVDAVYKKISNPFFEKLMFDLRSRFGGHPIEMKSIVREIIRRKNEVRGFGMLADQTPMKNNIEFWNTFLHQDTPWFGGPEKIAKLVKYPVIYISTRRIKRGYYEIELSHLTEPPYKENSTEILDKYSKMMEDDIRRSPADWLWSHRRWKHSKNVNPK